MSQGRSKEAFIRVDTGVYPLEAVEAACYGLTDRAYVRIGRRAQGGLEVFLRPKDTPSASREALEGEFYNELLHQSLRLRVSEANRKIREYVVTKALVSAQPPSEIPQAPCLECAPQAPPPPPVDAELEKEIEKLLAEIEKGGEDPLGVAVPWEEKYGKATEAPGAASPSGEAPSGEAR